MREILYGKCKALIYKTRSEMGLGAGKKIETVINNAISKNGEARVIFASAPSQNETLNYLANEAKVDWNKVVAFHMDEYVGISKQAPQSFSKFLEDRLVDKHTFKQWNPMLATDNLESEMISYAKSLTEKPIDLVILGIGENGHLAFNDPPVADFEDKEIVKVVDLDEVCRQQQVNDGCFASLNDVPTQALTITIPPLLACEHVLAVVPGPTKRAAIRSTLLDEVSTKTPSTILRTIDCELFIDNDSYEFVDKEK